MASVLMAGDRLTSTSGMEGFSGSALIFFGASSRKPLKVPDRFLFGTRSPTGSGLIKRGRGSALIARGLGFGSALIVRGLGSVLIEGN